MSSLRDALEELATDVPEYGDLDAAIAQSDKEHRRWSGVRRSVLAAAAGLLLVAGALVVARDHDGGARARDSVAGPGSLPLLAEGPLVQGRYRFVLQNSCEDPPYDCPSGAAPPAPLDLDVTVPAGWQHLAGFPVITPAASTTPTTWPDGAALVLGWTNFWARVHSDPCLVAGTHGEPAPDVSVGPSVDDFVSAVLAQKALDVTAPLDTQVGGHPARFFTLQVPTDIKRCDNWLPWAPAPYAQGPENTWDVWVVDVSGFRVLLVAEHFPDTPTETVAQLRAMVASITFGR